MDMSDMFQVFRKEVEWAGRKLVLETGKIARQADGAVLATYGGTTVLATVVFEKHPKPGLDFFPLTVNYQEKAFAAGKIPGGFFKREGRPSEKEVLTSRLIDRPIRPLFHESYRNETLVVITTLAHDMENDPDIVSMIATSAALTISGVPFMGPIGAARVAYIDGKYVINPTLEETEKSVLDLVVAGTTEGVLMVESEAKELSEEVMLTGVMEGHRSFQPVIEAIIQLAEHCAKEPLPLTDPSEASATVAAKLKAEMRGKLAEAYGETQKLARQTKVGAVKAEAKKLFEGKDAELATFGEQFGNLEADVVRGAILDTGKRIDGRDTKTVRPIVAEVGVLPRAHGSSLFTRGETQALVVATLGTGQDEQIIDALEGEYREHFMLHYNFPPYSVGEAGRMGSPMSGIVVEYYGGAPGRVGPAESAFAQRKSEYNVGMMAQWTDPGESDTHIGWTRAMYNAFEAHTSGQHLLNFQSDQGDDMVRASFGANYARLAEVKRKYDPGNFFSLNQNIKAAAA